jgi:hypothetical protein
MCVTNMGCTEPGGLDQFGALSVGFYSTFELL